MNDDRLALPAPDVDDVTTDAKDLVRRAIAFDDARPSLRNEHFYTAIAGAGFWLLALVTSSRSKAVCHATIGGMLLMRAASGRDGLRKWAGAEPQRPAALPASTSDSPTILTEA